VDEHFLCEICILNSLLEFLVEPKGKAPDVNSLLLFGDAANLKNQRHVLLNSRQTDSLEYPL
jgi:hypothetical protein